MSDPYSHRAVWRIAAPMMLSLMSAPLLGMVDTAVMGHLDGPWYLAAVAAGAAIFSVVFVGLNFLRMGTTGITAQSLGARDFDGVREALAQALIVAVVLALALIALRGPLLDVSLRLLAPSDEVAAMAAIYFHIRIFSAPASLMNYVLIGWLLGMQNARGPLAIMLSINVTNIVLDLIFVVGLGMTVDGVALATLLAELVGLAVGAVFVRQELAGHDGGWPANTLFQLSSYRRLFAVNANLLLRTLGLMFVFTFITARGARMGDTILAVNAVLMNFQFFLAYALDGIANAAEALVGKASGARDRDGLERAIRRTLQWSVIFATGFMGVYALAGNGIVTLLTSLEPIRALASEFMPWIIISPLVSVWSFLYDGVYVGLTRSREMMVVMVGSALLVFLPVWAATTGWGNHGLWLAFTCFMAARGIGMHVWLNRLRNRDALVTASV